MLSDAALYHSTAHPEKARLLFNTQLHQALQSIARNRELVPSSGGGGARLATPDPFAYGAGLNGAMGVSVTVGRATELNGWDLEKKMVALQEICELLQRPFFFYADWATAAAASAREKRVNSLLYFSKTLPLQLGQTTLLDLWDYVMDMCDHVPVRNRCRALYLHVAACLCRRAEFIEGYELDGERVHVAEHVSERYHKLLVRCVQFSAVKLAKARFLPDDHKLFIAHMYTALFFRFPCSTAKLLTAVLDTTATLERTEADETDEESVNPAAGQSRSPPLSPSSRLPRLHVSAASNVRQAKRPQRKSTLRGYRSPRGHCRHWNVLGAASEDATAAEEGDSDRVSQIARAKQQAFAAFVAYKATRGTHDLLSGNLPAPFKKGARSADASLELAFQQMMEAASEAQEIKFFEQLPLLYLGNVTEPVALASLGVSREELLDELLEPFLDRLTTPGRDDLTAATFVSAFLSDVNSWCAHRKELQPQDNDSSSDVGILWHCVPGYFSVVRLFVAVFQLMCQRRPRMAAVQPAPASVGRVLSIIEGGKQRGPDDPWLSYWSAREVETVLEAAGEVLKNEFLTNVLVKIVLETTNMHDPVSVNYSFGILQRVLETAAKSASNRSLVVPPPAANPAAARKAARSWHRLSDKFDDEYFIGVMRRALQSAHVQILLKVLTCLYNSIDLLPANVRKRLIGEMILRDNFFRFFMHWNEEIRKIFCYIIVFKTSLSNRLDLPCATDRILLAHSPYFESTGVAAAPSSSTSSSSSSSSSPLSAASPSSFGYWTHLSDMAQSMLRSSGVGLANNMEAEKKGGASALKRLVAWDCNVRLRKNRGGAHDVLFRDALVNDELSVDLSIGSKLDALFKMLADQMNQHKNYFPRTLEAYVERALAQYVAVLWEYYEAAFGSPTTTPTAPTLAFTITTPVFTD